ncbi:MAG: chorismate synthase [Verrucomicrobiae bacterium]|nr:chorismate synthase [Verrucomicrobiae bacterium]
MPNTFGHLFRITTFGESHGPAVGVVVDGCPARLKLSAADIQPDLDRRRPGQSHLVTSRQEADCVSILSGVFEGKTLGSPIALMVRNDDSRSEAYEEIRTKFRPSHADFTYQAKYGWRDWRGGGRASARESVGRVAAGSIARKWLREKYRIEALAYVKRVQHIEAEVDPQRVTLAQVEASPMRCPVVAAAKRMERLVQAVKTEGDSVGGVIECVLRGVPPGWGEPVFDKLTADFGKALLSIPAAKGFEVGSGFGGTYLRGSEQNDLFEMSGGRLRTRTNRSGGIQGGISNGEDILLRVAFKPTATIMRKQRTVDIHGKSAVLEPKGRHDPCVLPRAVPIVEAMALLVLMDHALRQRAVSGWMSSARR